MFVLERQAGGRPRRSGRRLLGLGLAMLSLALVAPAMATAAQPLEGYWYGTYNAQIRFVATGPNTFRGDITKLGTAACPRSLPPGGDQDVFRATGSGLSYTGEYQHVNLADCATAGYTSTTYTIELGGATTRSHLSICTVPLNDPGPPGPSDPNTQCYDYYRDPAVAVPVAPRPVPVRHAIARLPISCPQQAASACSGRILVLWHGKTLLRGGFTQIAPGATGTAVLRLTAAGRRHVRSHRGAHTMAVTYRILSPGLPPRNVAGILECDSRSL